MQCRPRVRSWPMNDAAMHGFQSFRARNAAPIAFLKTRIGRVPAVLLLLVMVR